MLETHYCITNTVFCLHSDWILFTFRALLFIYYLKIFFILYLFNHKYYCSNVWIV